MKYHYTFPQQTDCWKCKKEFAVSQSIIRHFCYDCCPTSSTINDMVFLPNDLIIYSSQCIKCLMKKETKGDDYCIKCGLEECVR